MTITQKNHLQPLLNKSLIKVIARLLLIALSYHLIFSPTAAIALSEAEDGAQNETSDQSQEHVATPDPVVIEELIFVNLGIKSVSAYNVGDVNQCDSTPCTSANGENICLALDLGYKRCAANFVPFGTLLEIEGYGRCLVTDRMNSRFSNHVDIAMRKDEKTEALKFGRRNLNIKIIKKINKS